MSACIIPTMRYADAKAAIDWLCKALGFSRHLVVEEPDGSIAHAQLVIGTSMVMLGTARDQDDGIERLPANLGGHVTGGVYLVAADIEQRFEVARAAGADIVMELEAQDYGGSAFSCRDPEGYLWHFGSYDPWSDA